MEKAESASTNNLQMKLLLVGNRKEDFLYLRGLLARAGDGHIGLAHAASPEEAATHMGHTTYDLVLCDYRPGENTALNLLREIRKNGSGCPVIFLTEQVNELVVAAAIKAG